MYCIFCGTKLEESARFCISCGHSVINKEESNEEVVDIPENITSADENVVPDGILQPEDVDLTVALPGKENKKPAQVKPSDEAVQSYPDNEPVFEPVEATVDDTEYTTDENGGELYGNETVGVRKKDPVSIGGDAAPVKAMYGKKVKKKNDNSEREPDNYAGYSNEKSSYEAPYEKNNDTPYSFSGYAQEKNSSKETKVVSEDSGDSFKNYFLQIMLIGLVAIATFLPFIEFILSGIQYIINCIAGNYFDFSWFLNIIPTIIFILPCAAVGAVIILKKEFRLTFAFLSVEFLFTGFSLILQMVNNLRYSGFIYSVKSIVLYVLAVLVNFAVVGILIALSVNVSNKKIRAGSFVVLLINLAVGRLVSASDIYAIIAFLLLAIVSFGYENTFSEVFDFLKGLFSGIFNSSGKSTGGFTPVSNPNVNTGAQSSFAGNVGASVTPSQNASQIPSSQPIVQAQNIQYNNNVSNIIYAPQLSNTAPYKHKGLGAVLGNIVWFIFGGFISACLWVICGLLWCITILGIPLGLQCFKFAKLMVAPFGKEVRYNGKTGSALLNILWIFFTGFWAALYDLIIGCVFCLTIIGIPFGLQYFKMAKLMFTPFGSEIV